MIPARYAPLLFAFILSGVMSLLVSGVATLRALGLVEGIIGLWITAWLPSWSVAFPTAFIVAPIARRLVARMTTPPPP